MSPMHRERYPDTWDEISKRIRFERAGNKCELCGVANGAFIIRSVVDGSRYIVFDRNKFAYQWPNGDTLLIADIPDEYPLRKYPIRVVLTTAHLDHDTANNDDSNLAAYCQRCHLRHDKDLHATHAKETRLEKRARAVREQGQTDMFEVVEKANND